MMNYTLRRVGAGLTVAATSFLPLIAAAQNEVRGFQDLLVRIQSVVNQIIPLILVLSLAWFFWGLFKYFMGGIGDNSDDARNTMFYGIITLFVMTTVWGLVNFVGDTVGIRSAAAPDIRTILPPTPTPR